MQQKQRPALVSWLLGAVTNMLVRSAASRPVGKRTRTPGAPGLPGSKLARKASEKSIGIRSGAHTVVFNAYRLGR